ncbi:hypothetical protein RB195_011647 [Necator americanus]|uniref:Endonuclease/exonuclease/phosphatase domain-containing protein n=2 Tax=Necator americanus TaxID=51031 RepID=A0ABR1D4A5_NECAM
MLQKRKRTRMTICTCNARTLASGAARDLMVQTKKIKYDVIGLTETRRPHPLNAVYVTGEELFLGTCDSRGVGGVGVLVNTSMAKKIDSFEQQKPESYEEEEEVKAFYMDLEKFYREDHASYKAIIGDFNAKKPSSLRWTWESPGGGYRNEIDHIIVNERDLFATLAGFWEDSAMDNIDEEYDRLIEHLHDCAKKAESSETTKRRLSLEILELIRQRGAARAAGNQELTSELARLCREAIKEDLKERRAEVLAEAAEAGRSIRYARRDFASRQTTMTTLRNPKGTTIASRRGMEKIIYDFYSDLFDSHVHLPPHHLREDGQVIPEVLPSEIRHAIMSVRNRTAPGPE